MGRILVVAVNYAPELTGCGQYTGDLGSALAARGNEVEVVTAPPHYPGWQVKAPYANRYSSEVFKGARLWRCPVLLRAKMGGIWRLIAPLSFAVTSAPVAFWRIVRMRPDTMVLIEPTLFAAPVPLLAAWLVGAKRVLHVQDLEVDAAFAVGHLASVGALKKLGFWFERMCLKAFDRIVTISGRMGERIAAKGVPQDEIVLVRNWVDLSHIRPLETSRAYRRELGLPEDAFVVLYSGNIGPKQGLDVVVAAARHLKDEPGVVFAIAGEEPVKDDLMRAAADLPNVVFLPFQPYERLPEFLALCDLHVLPQIASAADLVLPSKLGGMLASGRPMVVMAEPGTELADFLVGAATIVAPGDSQALAQGVREARHSAPDAEREARSAALARVLSRETAIEALEAAFLDWGERR